MSRYGGCCCWSSEWEGEVTEWDARLRVGCWEEGRGGDVGERDVGRAAAGEWREGPGIDGSGIWSESIVVGRRKALFLSLCLAR